MKCINAQATSLPASTGTVGSTPSTGIDGQADRIPHAYTGISYTVYGYATFRAIKSSHI